MICRPVSSGGGGALTVLEIDGSPSVSSVTRIKFNNGSMTDLGGGAVKVQFPFNFDGGNYADPYMASSADFDGGSY